MQDQVTAVQGDLTKCKAGLVDHGKQLTGVHSQLGQHQHALEMLQEKTAKHYERLDEHKLQLTSQNQALQASHGPAVLQPGMLVSLSVCSQHTAGSCTSSVAAFSCGPC